MTAFRNKLDITWSEVKKSKPQDYFYVHTVHLVYSFYFKQQCKIYINFNFRFSPCIIIVSHFYCPTNALNYTKLRV
jgi:hypothetical protein